MSSAYEAKFDIRVFAVILINKYIFGHLYLW